MSTTVTREELESAAEELVSAVEELTSFQVLLSSYYQNHDGFRLEDS